MGHVAHMGERRGLYKVLLERTDGRNHLEDLVIDGRIILKWVLKIRWENMDRIDLA